jgi:hypothetical protein
VPSLHFDADLSQWLRAFGNIEARIADATPAHEAIGDLLTIEARGNIVDEGGGANWPPLKDITLQRRAKSHPTAGTKPLLVTRALFRSITKDAQRGHVDVGSSIPYARTQFYGRGRIPARHPFAWRSGVMTRVAELYIKHLFGGLR